MMKTNKNIKRMGTLIIACVSYGEKTCFILSLLILLLLSLLLVLLFHCYLF